MVAQAVVVSFAVSLGGLLVLLQRLGRGLALDRPNERSLHQRPVPRTGGVAIVAGIAACTPFVAWRLWPALGIAVGSLQSPACAAGPAQREAAGRLLGVEAEPG